MTHAQNRESSYHAGNLCQFTRKIRANCYLFSFLNAIIVVMEKYVTDLSSSTITNDESKSFFSSNIVSHSF